MTSLVLPNVRKLFIPDPGYTMFEADLKGADAQIVAWEAEDEDLKEAFRKGLDIHAKNAEDMWGTEFTKLSGHAKDARRQQCKRTVHLTNYGGTPRTIAIAIGWTTHESETFQRRWFGLHPGIKSNFQGKIQRSLHQTRTVFNKYGFRRRFFGRIDDAFTEALAWIPQSSVALTTFYGAFQLEYHFPKTEILLQVHDSLVFQIPNSCLPTVEELKMALLVSIPYDDPLFIPWDIKYSTRSWGEMEKYK
jgi:DNA polymerase-1